MLQDSCRHYHLCAIAIATIESSPNHVKPPALCCGMCAPRTAGTINRVITPINNQAYLGCSTGQRDFFVGDLAAVTLLNYVDPHANPFRVSCSGTGLPGVPHSACALCPCTSDPAVLGAYVLSPEELVNSMVLRDMVRVGCDTPLGLTRGCCDRPLTNCSPYGIV